MPGVDKVTISLSKEAIMLTYNPPELTGGEGVREYRRMWAMGA